MMAFIFGMQGVGLTVVERARPSDVAGFWEDAFKRRDELLNAVPPAPTEICKPSLVGLGAVASGDHRLGLWRTIE